MPNDEPISLGNWRLKSDETARLIWTETQHLVAQTFHIAALRVQNLYYSALTKIKEVKKFV